MSSQTLKVLGALLDTGGGELSGVEIGRCAALYSGTLYPILMRLEEHGWLASRWEEGEPQVLGRPRRRFYRLTGLGQTRAVAAFGELQPFAGRLSLA